MSKFLVGLLMLVFLPIAIVGFLCPIIGAVFYFGWGKSDGIIMNWGKK